VFTVEKNKITHANMVDADDKKLEASVTAKSSSSNSNSSIDHSEPDAYITHDGQEAAEAHEHEQQPDINALRLTISRTRSVRSYASGAEGYTDITSTLQRQKTGTSLNRIQTTDPDYEIDFEDDDKGNPKNWTLLYKSGILAIMSFATSTV